MFYIAEKDNQNRNDCAAAGSCVSTIQGNRQGDNGKTGKVCGCGA